MPPWPGKCRICKETIEPLEMYHKRRGGPIHVKCARGQIRARPKLDGSELPCTQCNGSDEMCASCSVCVENPEGDLAEK